MVSVSKKGTGQTLPSLALSRIWGKAVTHSGPRYKREGTRWVGGGFVGKVVCVHVCVVCVCVCACMIEFMYL